MHSLAAAAWLWLAPSVAPAGEDAFYSIPLPQLSLTQGELPKGSYAWTYRLTKEHLQLLFPRAVVEEGEAYATAKEGHWVHGPFEQVYPAARLAVRSPAGRTVEGRLYVPRTDWSGAAELRFRIDPKDASADAREPFFQAKEAYYRRLAGLGIPGGAWFRHQADLARKELSPGEAAVQEPPLPGVFRPGMDRRDEVEKTYDLFTGSRALTENLQLDRAMPSGAEAEVTVPLAGIQGITVKAYDWKRKLAGASPKLDALAASIPADQFALFFPSFQAMTELLDEAERAGTPILQWLEPRSEDARTKTRYERQLCLEMSGLARLLGPQVVEEVAFTASDPYLREGTDVAVLFRAKPGMSKVIVEYVLAKQKAASEALTADRTVSSHLSEQGDLVVVANSTIQLRKVLAASKGEAPALASLDEYRYFRSRYAKGEAEESALLVLPDAAIRAWCSARWRIAESRRLRAAALLADLTAEHTREIVAGSLADERRIETKLRAPGGGEFFLGPSGVRHSIYGTLSFLTPIAEIRLDKATQQEADLYKRWREGYERNWSNFFDPIAVRFSVRPERVALDLTVQPLIVGSQYRDMIELSGRGERLRPGAGARHRGSLLHYAMSLDPESKTVKDVSGFFLGFAPQLKPNPFSWLGGAAAIFADDDPIWADMTKEGEDLDDYFKERPIRLPVALWVEVKNPLGLAAFLAGVRNFVQMTAPSITKWDTIEQEGLSYVRITANLRREMGLDGEDEEEEGAKDEALKPGQMAVYYVTTPEAFLVTLDEGVLKRHLERSGKKPAKEGKEPPGPPPWIGGSYGLHADAKILEIFGSRIEEGLLPMARVRAWGNLPILNEWRRLYPGRDPVELHLRVWGAELLCPGGGEYAWSEARRSMESTFYGSPAEPKGKGQIPEAVRDLRFGNFGLTFEEDGLRARAVVEREGR